MFNCSLILCLFFPLLMQFCRSSIRTLRFSLPGIKIDSAVGSKACRMFGKDWCNVVCAKCRIKVILPNLSLYSQCYAKACNECAGPISASLRPGNTASFEEMLERWRAVGNTVSNLNGPRFEPQTSRSRHERVTARLTGRFYKNFSPGCLTEMTFVNVIPLFFECYYPKQLFFFPHTVTL